MANRRQNGQARSTRRWMALVALGSMCISAALLTGCSSTPTTAQQHHDPLHGVLVPPGIAPQPTNAPKASNPGIAAPQTGSIHGIPAIPTNNTSSNNATLAGMSFQGPLGKPLAIDDEGRTLAPGQLTARSQPLGFVPPNPNPKVEQVPDAYPSASRVTPSGSWQTSASNVPPLTSANKAAPGSAEAQITQQLQAHGVVNQKIDPVPEGVRLTCYLPRTDSPGLRVLEVTAADYVTAAQAILRQLP